MLALPPAYAEATYAAEHDYGRRRVILTLGSPGSLHRNAFTRATIEVTERHAWKAEPLWVSATRSTQPAGWQRSAFTEAAHRAIAAEVLPVVNRYGFARLWLELHALKAARLTEAAERGAAQAARVAEWCAMRLELAEMLTLGLLEFRGLTDDQANNGYGNGTRVDIAPERGSTELSRRAVASAWLDGEHVGWMVEHGDILPLNGLLR